MKYLVILVLVAVVAYALLPEDLLFALRPDWLDPEGFHDLVRAGDRMLAELGERSRSRASAGAHGNGREFDWTLPTT